MVGTSGSQYAPNFGAARAQYDPSIRAAGLQYDPSTRAAGSMKPAQAAGPASSLGSALLGEAINWLGVPYGGAGVTCTGFVAAVYEKFGYSLSLSEAGQLGAVGSLNSGSPPPGSIAFWSEDGSCMPTHVGRYRRGRRHGSRRQHRRRHGEANSLRHSPRLHRLGVPRLKRSALTFLFLLTANH